MRIRSLSTIWLLVALTSIVAAQGGGELHFSIKSDPKTLNPLLVEDDSSETVRYITGGVLIRVNRKTQENQPELAKSWKVTDNGRQITFKLREGLEFSDGTPFTSDDVIATIKALMDPKLHSSTGDAFRAGTGDVVVQSKGKYSVSVVFPQPIAGLERLFDQVAITPARMAGNGDARVVLGPFMLSDHKAGEYVLLKRNPHYWKKDSTGHSLPYLDAVRLYVLQNRDTELLRFRHNDIHLVNNLSPDLYEQLHKQEPAAARDLGPSIESEQMWFNQAAKSPLPEYKRAWFRSRNFRQAISMAINRADLARVAFHGHATPSVGLLSPANKLWFDTHLKPQQYDPKAALELLKQDGFHKDGNVLKDKTGKPVVFSLITNSGNKPRERMGSLIQEDLRHIGIKLNFVPLDFPSVIERLTATFDYEACMLGLTNVDLDPNGQMNVWLSSADNHQWNPAQKTPQTPWEAEIDGLMHAQASTLKRTKRKGDFDKVQQIVADQQPMLFLVDKNALVAVSPAVKNAYPVVLTPQTYWNIEYLSLNRK